MQVWLVSALPGWLLGVIIVGAAVATALGGQRLISRLIPVQVRQDHNDIAGFVIAVIGAVYAVTLALVVVAVWEEHDAAHMIAEHEASALSALYRGAASFAPPERVRLRTGIEAYARTVVDDEWKVFGVGGDSSRAEEDFQTLWNEYLTIEPVTGRENAAYAAALDQLQTASVLRHERLLTNRTTLPGTLWIALIAGFGITVGFVTLFGAKDERMHAMMTAAAAGIIGLGLWLTFLMDAPYSGSLGVPPEALQRSLELFTRLGR